VPLEKLLLTESLKERFHDKIEKSKAVGTDGISSEQFASILDSEVELIQRKVTNMTYRFSRFNEKLILKNKSSLPRAVYIPTVRDRLVLNTLNTYLSEKFSEDLAPYQLTVKEIIKDIIQTLESDKYDAFIKLDIKNFFPSLDHKILLDKLQKRLNDKTAFSLLKKALNRSQKGIAQGLSISSQLAAIYLNDVDKSFTHRTTFKYFRFVDDILILCNHSEIQSIESEVKQQITDLGLDLHPTIIGGKSGKSGTGYLKENTLEYLGFSFSGNKISVRESSVEKLRKRIRQVFSSSLNDISLLNKNTYPEFYYKLNLKITGCLYNNRPYGWLFFFQDINDLTLLHHLDWFVKKSFEDFEIKYDPDEVKSFVKTYFAMKSLNPHKLDAESYIPSFNSGSITAEKSPVSPIDILGFKRVSETKEHNISKHYDLEELEELIFDLDRDIELY